MALMMDLLFPWGVQVGKNTQTLEKHSISPVAGYTSILSWNGPCEPLGTVGSEAPMWDTTDSDEE